MFACQFVVLLLKVDKQQMFLKKFVDCHVFIDLYEKAWYVLQLIGTS